MFQPYRFLGIQDSHDRRAVRFEVAVVPFVTRRGRRHDDAAELDNRELTARALDDGQNEFRWANRRVVGRMDRRRRRAVGRRGRRFGIIGRCGFRYDDLDARIAVHGRVELPYLQLLSQADLRVSKSGGEKKKKQIMLHGSLHHDDVDR